MKSWIFGSVMYNDGAIMRIVIQGKFSLRFTGYPPWMVIGKISKIYQKYGGG